MFKEPKQFCRWVIKYDHLPAQLKKLMEQQLVKSAHNYCARQGLKPDEYVMTTLSIDEIPFSFIINVK